MARAKNIICKSKKYRHFIFPFETKNIASILNYFIENNTTLNCFLEKSKSSDYSYYLIITDDFKNFTTVRISNHTYFHKHLHGEIDWQIKNYNLRSFFKFIEDKFDVIVDKKYRIAIKNLIAYNNWIAFLEKNMKRKYFKKDDSSYIIIE
jgi:hypothetical protein